MKPSNINFKRMFLYFCWAIVGTIGGMIIAFAIQGSGFVREPRQTVNPLTGVAPAVVNESSLAKHPVYPLGSEFAKPLLRETPVNSGPGDTGHSFPRPTPFQFTCPRFWNPSLVFPLHLDVGVVVDCAQVKGG